MPRISLRQRVLKHLRSNLTHTEEFILQEHTYEAHDDALMHNDDDEKDYIGPADVELLFLSTSEEIEHVQSTRYLLPRILSKTTHNMFMEDLDPNSPYRLYPPVFHTPLWHQNYSALLCCDCNWTPLGPVCFGFIETMAWSWPVGNTSHVAVFIP